MTNTGSDRPRVQAGRRPELDAIRVVVVTGLIFFHAALVFDSRDDFYVKNAETTDVVTIVAGFGVLWAMPSLFLIAGLGAWHSLRRRGAGGFAVERLRRLGVPLLVATVTILPISPWLRLRTDPTYQESYLEFLPRFFDVRLNVAEFPFVVQGEFFESGHLWFVVLLLAFSLLLAPLVRWFPGDACRVLCDRLAAWTSRRGAVLLPAVLFGSVSALVGLEEDFAAWSRWAYLMFFLSGFVLAADDRFRAAMRRDALLAAILAATLFLGSAPGFVLSGDAPGDDPFTGMSSIAVATRALYGAAGWCCVVAILGLLDRRRQTRDETSRAGHDRGRVYGYVALGVLPIYILHQPVVVGFAYGVVRWDAPILAEYLVIVAASLAATVAAYDVLRRTKATRILVGMRG